MTAAAAAASPASAALVVDFSAASGSPLNPLGLALRRHIWEALETAEHDPTVHSVILYGGDRGITKSNFSAGADLTEFEELLGQQQQQQQKRHGREEQSSYPLVELVRRIEDCPKPVVAAVRGNALGGGLEVALACHYRVTDETGRFGLPEVHVGVIPGAGGTQRLPRLVTVAKATEMILTGRPIGAEEAKKSGLVDHVHGPEADGGSLLEVARKWADWAALMPVQDRRVGRKKVAGDPREWEAVFAAAAKKVPPLGMGGEGMHAALQAVRACTTLPIEEGSAVELEWFLKTLAGSQGKARRHAFFAVRKAQKPLGRPPRDHPLLQTSFDNQVAGVVGAGLMGSGICMVLLQAGFTVHLLDVYKESLDKGVAFLKDSIQSYVKRGRMSEGRAKKMLQSLKPTQRMDDLSNCSLVVEAVIEDMKIKKAIFTELDKITPKDCILLSNTSTLDIDEMASAVTPARRPLFAGWHFFSPAHVMRLVEIVLGAATSMETACVMQQLTKRVGKTGVVVGNCDGFVGNRLLIPYSGETALLLEEGVATVAAVDDACLRFGMALGPFQMGDLAGLDVGYNIRKHRGWVSVGGAPGPNRPARYADVADVMVADNKRLGQKSGKVSPPNLRASISLGWLVTCICALNRCFIFNTSLYLCSRAGMTTTRTSGTAGSHCRARKWTP
jgi:3-hydroxyacyl-CoA dehydrogenase